MESLSAAADMITGSVLARAVEPGAGESTGTADRGTCLNCRAALTGPHCHMCGQNAHTHRTLSAFGHDILHSVFHFDGKIWRTLPMLVWYPGDLTRRYIHGERAKFVSPLALFLFTVFLTFALFTLIMPKDAISTETLTPAQASTELQADRQALIGDIAALEAERKAAIAAREPSGWIDAEIARNRKELATMETGTAATAAVSRRFSRVKRRAESRIARHEAELARARTTGKPTASIEEHLASERLALKLIAATSSTVSGDKKIKFEWDFTDLDFPGAAALNETARHAAENPQLTLYKVQSNAYKYSWALIPISVPFLWLLFFWHRKVRLFDHTVFVTYSLCFMMIGLLLAAFLISVPALEVAGALLIVFGPPLHMYRQLKQAYGLTRVGALWRTSALVGFAVLAFTLFASLIITLGVAG